MTRIISLLISTYIAALIYTQAFFIRTLTILDGADQLFWNHLAIFMILLMPIHFLINRYVSMPYSRGSMRHVRVALTTVAFIGLCLALLYHVIPLEPIYNLPPFIDQIFASDTAFTIWLILPLLVLFI